MLYAGGAQARARQAGIDADHVIARTGGREDGGGELGVAQGGQDGRIGGLDGRQQNGEVAAGVGHDCRSGWRAGAGWASDGGGGEGAQAAAAWLGLYADRRPSEQLQTHL